MTRSTNPLIIIIIITEMSVEELMVDITHDDDEADTVTATVTFLLLLGDRERRRWRCLSSLRACFSRLSSPLESLAEEFPCVGRRSSLDADWL